MVYMLKVNIFHMQTYTANLKPHFRIDLVSVYHNGQSFSCAVIVNWCDGELRVG